MQTLQFDYHIGHYHSLAAVQTDYPLLKFTKIIHLNCHVLCAMDNALNLHFIQFRDKTPFDPTIYPPWFALTSHPKILFSIDPLTLFKQVKKKYLNEEEFMGFYVTLDYMWENEPEICTIKPGVMFYKPVKRGFVYLFDFTKKDNKPQIITSLVEASNLSMYNENIVLFSSYRCEGIFIYHLHTEKMKKLNFRETNPLNLKVVPKRNLCIAVFMNLIEVLDIMDNIVIERFVIESMTDNMIAISPNCSRIVHGYLHGKVLEGNMYIDIWDFNKDSKIIKKDPFHLDNSLGNEHYIEFMNDNILVHARRWQVNLFKIEDTGIMKLHTFSAMSDHGYIKTLRDGHCIWSHLSLTIVGPKTFLLLTSDVYEDAYNRIESFDIDMQIESLSDNKISNSIEDRIGKITWHPLNVDGGSTNDVALITILNTQAEQVFLEKVDFINSICSWKNEKVGLLYESNRFYEYNLQTGKLCKVMSISGVEYHHEFLKKIAYVDADHIALSYQKENLKIRLIIISLASQKKVLDTKELKIRENYQTINCTSVNEEGVVLVYQKFLSAEGFIGKFDLQTRKMRELIKIEQSKILDFIWSIGNNCLAGRCKFSNRTLLIWDLEKKALVLEKKFARLSENLREELGSPELIFWDVTKLSDELICFISRGIFNASCSVVVYNWQRDNIIAKCQIKAEEIFGVINNELYVLLEESFPQSTDTFYATISIGKALHDQYEKKIHNLGHNYFGKFFLGLERGTFECLANQKNAILVIKQFFPHHLFVMRRRNKRAEILRHLKRELADFYHPYLIQEVTRMITG